MLRTQKIQDFRATNRLEKLNLNFSIIENKLKASLGNSLFDSSTDNDNQFTYQLGGGFGQDDPGDRVVLSRMLEPFKNKSSKYFFRNAFIKRCEQ